MAAVMIEQLTRNITQAHLEEIFHPYGRIRRCQVALNPVTGMPRGYAYLEYERPEEAQRAIEYMHGGQIDGAVIKVESLQRTT